MYVDSVATFINVNEESKTNRDGSFHFYCILLSHNFKKSTVGVKHRYMAYSLSRYYRSVHGVMYNVRRHVNLYNLLIL